ncbi:MAG: hypothetical protein EOP45_12085 [Sphingobacteriaceae bacterium]|nr:MAG: hypothetical protein EOP45_12085 [Sphingobacteriaceae bacterium]
MTETFNWAVNILETAHDSIDRLDLAIQEYITTRKWPVDTRSWDIVETLDPLLEHDQLPMDRGMYNLRIVDGNRMIRHNINWIKWHLHDQANPEKLQQGLGRHTTQPFRIYLVNMLQTVNNLTPNKSDQDTTLYHTLDTKYRSKILSDSESETLLDKY